MATNKPISEFVRGEPDYLFGFELPGKGRNLPNLRRCKTAAALIADARYSYTAGDNRIQVSAGDIIETADGARFPVQAPDASGQDLTTAGGVKLKVSDAARWDIRAFGATPGADCRTIIQLAEDKASALATATGSAVILDFPKGTYYLSGGITKKAGVHWRGDGHLCRQDNLSATGAAFALVTASGVDDWSIDGLTLENVGHDRIESAAVTQNFTLGGGNTCVHVSNCDRWSITNCSLLRFSRGIMFWECDDFRIAGNKLRATTGKTLASMIDGTFVNYSTITNTFGIGIGYKTASSVTSPAPASRRGIISENHVEVVGLDIAIEGLSQTYDYSPMTIIGNITIGGNASCQCYRGSFVDPGSAPTYHGGMVIALNRFTYSWQQGLYQRGTLGSLIMGNHFERTGMFGLDGNSSTAAICLRVNPFQNDGTVQSYYTSAAAGTVSNDHATVVTGNRIVNHGKASAASMAAVLIEQDNVLFQGNTIERTAEFSTSAQGNAIYIANGKELRNVTVRDNEIIGVFQRGISIEEATGKTARLTDIALISGNKLRGSFTTAIYCLWYSVGAIIENNIVAATCTTGIFIQASPKSKIRGNTLTGALTTGIQVAAGCLLSDIPNRLSGNAISASNRRGGSVAITGNDISGAATAFSATSTITGDTQIYGRSSEFRDNFVDGSLFQILRGSGGAPSSNDAKVWAVGEVILNSAIAAAASPGKICVAAGQGGSTATTTGDTTSGSPIITNVASFDGYAPGLFISPSGFTAGRKIIAIDIVANTMTVDADASATAAGVTLTMTAPTFASLAALT